MSGGLNIVHDWVSQPALPPTTGSLETGMPVSFWIALMRGNLLLSCVGYRRLPPGGRQISAGIC